MPWSSSRALGVLALVLPNACGSGVIPADAGGGLDAGAGFDGSSHDASNGVPDGPSCPTDAALTLVDAEQLEPPVDGGYPVFCDIALPSLCPAEQPYCCRRYSEDDFPDECSSARIANDCSERPPDDAVPSECRAGSDLCIGDHPLCCGLDDTEVCTNRRLLGWSCMPGCFP